MVQTNRLVIKNPRIFHKSEIEHPKSEIRHNFAIFT
jgi:hypothetical protein